MPFRPHFSVLDLKSTSGSSWRSRQESRAKSPEKTESSSSPLTALRKSNTEKKEAASGASRGLQSDSLASRTATSGETKSIDKATPTMTPSVSMSRTSTSGSSLTALMSKKAEDTPPPLARTRKRSGKESKEVSSGNQKDAVRPLEDWEPFDRKNIKVNEGDVKSKCDRKDRESGEKNQVWSKDSKHMKQVEKEVPNKKPEHSNSNKENKRGAETKAQKRDAKEEADVQTSTTSNRNKFISNPLRRSLKSRKSIKRQGSVKRGQTKPGEETLVMPKKKAEQADDDLKKADEHQTDPLNFIEIRSAAQWKAISQRISWKFDDCPEETSATTEEPSGKTRVLPKSRVGAVTLKAPQFPDIPHE